MKKFISTLLFLTTITFAFSNLLEISDPLNPWERQKANIDSAIITVTPFTYYAQVDLVLNYSTLGSNFYQPNNDTWLELVSEIAIPENTIVVDSWLWIEDYISEAYLIDLKTATNVYESYVQRTNDPSLLRYKINHNDVLSFNIYPLPANDYRKVKLSFLIPINKEGNTYSVNPLIDFFKYENKNESSYCKIKVFNNELYSSESLRTLDGNYIILNSSNNFTEFEMDMNEISNSFAITYQSQNETDLMAHFIEENEQFGYYVFEKFIPFNENECALGSVLSMTDDSSIVINELNEIEYRNAGVNIKQIGQYFYKPPGSIIIESVCENDIERDTIEVDYLEDFSSKQIWANAKIKDLTINQSNASSFHNNYYTDFSEPNYSKIILTSMEYRVLSFYTAFLALPQEDTVFASVNPNSNENIIIGIDEIAQEPEINCYPNPFESSLNVEVKNMDPIIEVSLINYLGQIISRIENPSEDIDGVFRLQFENLSSQLEAGIYLLQIKTGNNNFARKIIKE